MIFESDGEEFEVRKSVYIEVCIKAEGLKQTCHELQYTRMRRGGNDAEPSNTSSSFISTLFTQAPRVIVLQAVLRSTDQQHPTRLVTLTRLPHASAHVTSITKLVRLALSNTLLNGPHFKPREANLIREGRLLSQSLNLEVLRSYPGGRLIT